MQFIPILTALVALTAVFTPTLDAQCRCQKPKTQCCLESTAKPGATAKVTIKAKASATAKTSAKLVQLFNDSCPVSGRSTSAGSPVVSFGDKLVSLCCNGCASSLKDLEADKKTSFLANYTGKNRRDGFRATKVKAAKGQDVKTTGTAKKSCCADKAAAAKQCCAVKAAAAKQCCADKAAAAKQCCAVKAAAAK